MANGPVDARSATCRGLARNPAAQNQANETQQLGHKHVAVYVQRGWGADGGGAVARTCESFGSCRVHLSRVM